MKEILEKIFAQLPSYIPDLAALIARPKRTIALRNTGAPDDLKRAIAFVAITVGIGFLLQAPSLPAKWDFVTTASAMAVLKLLALTGFSAAIWGTFRALRGQGTYLRTLIAYLYLAAPLYLLGTVARLVFVGLVTSYDPDVGLGLRLDPSYFDDHPEQLSAFASARPTLAYTYTAVGAALIIIILLWAFACQGAFRAVHGISRLRSGIAFVAMLAALVLFYFVLDFTMRGIFGGPSPLL